MSTLTTPPTTPDGLERVAQLGRTAAALWSREPRTDPTRRTELLGQLTAVDTALERLRMRATHTVDLTDGSALHTELDAIEATLDGLAPHWGDQS